MLTVYHSRMSVCSNKVRIALAEKGVSWTDVLLDLTAGEQFAPEYLAKNPNGVVPTIEHDGRVLIESTVINEYIDDAFPGRLLKPADAYERALMRLWTKQPDEGVHDTVNTLSFAIAFRLGILKLPPEERTARINKIPDAYRRQKRFELVERGIDSPLVDTALARFDKLFADMERQLGRTKWLAGDTYSLADVGITPYVHRVDMLGLSPMWTQDRPRVTDWLARVRARPSYAVAITDFDPPERTWAMNEAGAAAWPLLVKRWRVG
jgi:glutathione S-transferase